MTDKPNPVLGMVQTAVGRAGGLSHFGGTTTSFLNSLAPLLAFPLATSMIEAYREKWLEAASVLLVTLVAQLAPPVVSHLVAVRWRMEDRWLHYATAYNWCHWALPLAGALFTFLFALAVSAGLPNTMVTQGVPLCLGLYGLWLNWFIAYRALGLSRIKAVGFLAIVIAGTAALMFGPALIDWSLSSGD